MAKKTTIASVKFEILSVVSEFARVRATLQNEGGELTATHEATLRVGESFTLEDIRVESVSMSPLQIRKPRKPT